MWEPLCVSNVENIVKEWLPLPDVAEMLDVSITKVHALVKDGSLLSARVGERNIRAVPAEFISGDHVLESLRGTITVLHDAGFEDEEAILWLFTDDESLPGRPIDALREGRKTEIRRRASALGW
ncbi:Rv2175c family DNA-binding protein [Arthrobacter stackebrandtii]|uniref:Rv2175c family DNA-binding protein n=1 Tax=Arthrobacter stackebrandtii TaxID=272161 RepID=UPI000D9A2142|nr:Rv2175c family DNA-binding protein [Arthrobacter stackebrandtii]PYH00855.1 DNA-binding protein [Arthrobacter stackebrandtii]